MSQTSGVEFEKVGEVLTEVVVVVVDEDPPLGTHS